MQVRSSRSLNSPSRRSGTGIASALKAAAIAAFLVAAVTPALAQEASSEFSPVVEPVSTVAVKKPASANVRITTVPAARRWLCSTSTPPSIFGMNVP